eukprot:TRINITY_DN26533_c0_g1_i1.p1 TRINITY_DN26533_c0_g1~~TRINITY_DN26533_c0_g1_i1.p1  ORF type:complete len:295 (+),score=82.67 TRINITY_DN26533_c0_g1_i1:65-949(+)
MPDTWNPKAKPKRRGYRRRVCWSCVMLLLTAAFVLGGLGDSLSPSVRRLRLTATAQLRSLLPGPAAPPSGAAPPPLAVMPAFRPSTAPPDEPEPPPAPLPPRRPPQRSPAEPPDEPLSAAGTDADDSAAGELAIGVAVEARRDLRVGGTVVVRKASPGRVVSEAPAAGSKRRWAVRFAGTFGIERPVTFAVMRSDVRVLPLGVRLDERLRERSAKAALPSDLPELDAAPARGDLVPHSVRTLNPQKHRLRASADVPAPKRLTAADLGMAAPRKRSAGLPEWATRRAGKRGGGGD